MTISDLIPDYISYVMPLHSIQWRISAVYQYRNQRQSGQARLEFNKLDEDRVLNRNLLQNLQTTIVWIYCI